MINSRKTRACGGRNCQENPRQGPLYNFESCYFCVTGGLHGRFVLRSVWSTKSNIDLRAIKPRVECAWILLGFLLTGKWAQRVSILVMLNVPSMFWYSPFSADHARGAHPTWYVDTGS